MTEPAFLPAGIEVSRRRLLALSAVAIPAGALFAGAGRAAGPRIAVSVATQPEHEPPAHPSATAALVRAPAEQVYFC